MKKVIYLPRASYTNKTSGALKEYFIKNGFDVLEGSRLDARKTKLWEQADYIIPPTAIELHTFLRRIHQIKPQIVTDKVKQAIALAKTSHAGQKRLNGTDYFTGHILPCALYLTLVQTLQKDTLTEDMVVAMICHDLVEDTETKGDEIENLFGSIVADYVDSLTKRPINGSKPSSEQYVDQILGSNSYEVLVLKAVDRLLNVTDDIQNLVFTRQTERVYKYVKNSIENYRVIFERVSERNDYYLKMFDLVTKALNEGFVD